MLNTYTHMIVTCICVYVYKNIKCIYIYMGTRRERTNDDCKYESGPFCWEVSVKRSDASIRFNCSLFSIQSDQWIIIYTLVSLVCDVLIQLGSRGCSSQEELRYTQVG